MAMLVRRERFGCCAVQLKSFTGRRELVDHSTTPPLCAADAKRFPAEKALQSMWEGGREGGREEGGREGGRREGGRREGGREGGGREGGRREGGGREGGGREGGVDKKNVYGESDLGRKGRGDLFFLP